MPHPLSRSESPTCSPWIPLRRPIQYEGHWLSWGQLGDYAHARSARWPRGTATVIIPASASCCATSPLTSRPCSACCWPAAPWWSSIRPAVTSAPAPTSARCDSRCSSARPTISPASSHRPRRPRWWRSPTLADTTGGHSRGRPPAADPGRPGVAVWMLTSGTTGPPKRVDLTYDMLAHSVIGRDPDSPRRPTAAAPRGRDRQLAAGARRRRVPGAAVHRRGAPVRAAAEVRPPDRGPQPSANTDRGRCRWCPPRCGWCCTPT